MLSLQGFYSSTLEYTNTLALYLFTGLAVTENATMVLNNSLGVSIFAEYSTAANDSGRATARLGLGVIDRPRIKPGF